MNYTFCNFCWHMSDELWVQHGGTLNIIYLHMLPQPQESLARRLAYFANITDSAKILPSSYFITRSVSGSSSNGLMVLLQANEATKWTSAPWVTPVHICENTWRYFLAICLVPKKFYLVFFQGDRQTFPTCFGPEIMAARSQTISVRDHGD